MRHISGRSCTVNNLNHKSDKVTSDKFTFIVTPAKYLASKREAEFLTDYRGQFEFIHTLLGKKKWGKLLYYYSTYI